MRRVLLLASVLVVAGASPAGATTKTYSNGRVLAVPAGGSGESSIRVPDAGPVSRVAVSVRVAGPVGALTLSLVAPDGRSVLLTRQQASGDAFGDGGKSCNGTPTQFTSDAYASPLLEDKPPYTGFGYRPAESLARLNGAQARGWWRLGIESAGGAATLYCWQLDLSRAVVQTQTASAERTRATLSYVETNNRYDHVSVRIARAGRTVVDAPLAKLNCTGCPSDGFDLIAGSRMVAVRDLDGDGEPEVLVDLYTGGAHCCFFTLVFRYRPESRTYGRTSAFWGDLGYELRDLDHDRIPELVSGDDRFAYAFTAYAASAFPIEIWAYRAGHISDVTRSFPIEVGDDAARHWKEYLGERGDPSGDVRGSLAAWLADECLLGRFDDGWAKLQQAYRRGDLGHTKKLYGQPAGRAYLAALRDFLRKNGYLTS